MPQNYSSTVRYESKDFPGVFFILRRMTEGRRDELRAKIVPFNNRLRDLMKEQAALNHENSQTDAIRWVTLNDEMDELVLKMNPLWLLWGVKQIEGLIVDGKSLTIEEWPEWPSALFNEAVALVRSEAELNGLERKNSESPTTSGAPAASNQKPSTAQSAGEKDGGATETADSTLKIM